MPKERLDLLLVTLGHFPSREQAQRAILAGEVKVGDTPVTKPGQAVDTGANIAVQQKERYKSRGGLKLERALEVFEIKPEGRIVLDVGASTGGFTDCLLKGGAKTVIAVDVGYGQLAWELRQDPRVVVLERTNIRHLTPEALLSHVPCLPDLAVIDTSFISLTKVLPAVAVLLQPPKEVVALVKPQFEAGREKIGKKGVVRDPQVHREVIERVIETARSLGWGVQGLDHSPIKGPEGNIEFLLHLRAGEGNPIEPEAAVADAHRTLKEL